MKRKWRPSSQKLQLLRGMVNMKNTKRRTILMGHTIILPGWDSYKKASDRILSAGSRHTI
jgi:hypothetical protein